MTLSDILKYSANMLDDSALRSYLLGLTPADSSITDAIQALTVCANQVSHIIASDWSPVVKIVKVSSQDGKIPFSSIDSNGVLIVKTVKSGGIKSEFEVVDGMLVTAPGSVVVKYYAMPNALTTLTDSVTQFPCVSPIMFAYGVTAEYLYSKGNVEDAQSWNKRFEDSMRALSRGKNASCKAQRWY